MVPLGDVRRPAAKVHKGMRGTGAGVGAFEVYGWVHLKFITCEYPVGVA